ncbi:MAG TPA: isocitrate/isopropylmalate family dehydrogenase, partial [Magnetovibrio sp.]
MHAYKIAAIPGDGIGGEVIDAGIDVLQALQTKCSGFSLAIETLPWGTDYYLEHGHMMPDDGLD